MPRSDRLIRPDETDPRERPGAEVIDLATRTVVPQVARKRGHSDALVTVAGFAVVLLLGGVTLWSLNGARQAKPPVTAPAPAAAQPAAMPVVPPGAITMLQPPRAAPVALAQPGMAPAPVPAANRWAAPAVVFDASGNVSPVGPAAVTSPAVPLAVPSGAGSDDFAARLGVAGTGAAVATPGTDPKTTVSQGTLIPAVLETAIDTDVPGFVRAVVSADVRSFDGSRVLVPRSSRLIGQYKSGMQAGQKRAYVIWTRLIRPDGASVNLGSPAIGFGGETGVAGKVDSHFFDRFGSAMLLSVIGGLQAVASGGTTLVLGGGQSAAAAAVGQTGAIGPTVRVRQGEPIRVFTARDLDFSRVSQP
jgi:type IV secretion system protein VirB10